MGEVDRHRWLGELQPCPQLLRDFRRKSHQRGRHEVHLKLGCEYISQKYAEELHSDEEEKAQWGPEWTARKEGFGIHTVREPNDGINIGLAHYTGDGKKERPDQPFAMWLGPTWDRITYQRSLPDANSLNSWYSNISGGRARRCA